MNKLKKRWKVLIVLCVLVFVVDVFLFIGIKTKYTHTPIGKKTVNAANKFTKQQTQIKNALQNINIKSKYGILVDIQNDKVLYEKNSNEKLYPASLTKVLTSIVALDNIHDLNQKVTITNDDLRNLVAEDASVAGLRVGDEVTYNQLLYALILPSGADAANALANHLDGNIPNFVEDMNSKAKAIGMSHSHFANTTGLHNENHYTTLQDMRKLMIYALKNPTFRRVITTPRYTIPNLKSHLNGLHLTSTLVSYTGSLAFPGGNIVGGKSGYTPEAGCCLISIAKMDNGHYYMFISAKAPGEPETEHYHMDDARLVYEKVASIDNKQENK